MIGRRRVAAIVGALAGVAAVALLAASASATDVIGTDPAGDGRGKAGLTKKERQALDIVSVHVVGEEGLGAFVTVTFKGNIEQRIGRGHLKDALVALVLHSKEGGSLPAGLVTEGAGPAGKTLRRTKSEQVGIVRDGRKLVFFVAGPGFGNVDAIEVKAFRRPPGASARVAQTPPPTVPDALWQRILKANVKSYDEVSRELPEVAKLTCNELRALERLLSHVLTTIDHELNDPFIGDETDALLRDKRLLRNVRDHVRELTGGRCLPPGGIPEPTQIVGVLDWDLFSGNPFELIGVGRIDVVAPPRTGRTQAAAISLDAVKVVILGSHTITAYFCPSQLPSGSLSETNRPADTLTCTGGALQTGQQFTLNARMTPAPTAGMGGQLFGRPAGAAFQGPFQITGP